jgi:hemerythrin superfamily protein
MNAIKLLKHQHREVEALFKQIHKARAGGPRRAVFERIADALAVHAAIEERHFYRSVKEKTTEVVLLESLEEHLAIKRVIADLLQLDAEDETFAAKIKVLEDEVEHHVEEEEEVLFPRVERMFDDEALESIGEAMEETQAALLQSGNPRQAVPSETERAATL